MDRFFHTGDGPNRNIMDHLQAMMGGGPSQYPFSSHFQRHSEPSYRIGLEPAQIPEEFMKEARFQPGYEAAEAMNDAEMEQLESPKMASHNYDDFEKKLQDGILDTPNLHLHEIPQSIFDNNPPIKIIYLKENQINELPEFFFDELPLLAWLDLRDNKLSSLPGLNTKHESLRVILLQGNRIRALPHTLALAANLRTLGLTGNPLTIPPINIQKQGCKKMLEYLKNRMLERVPMDELGGFEEISTNPEDDEKLREDLKKTAMKSVKRRPSISSLKPQLSVASINSKTEEEKKAERLIYTWELWKRIPYDGKTQSEVFQRSFDDVKTQVVMKLNAQKEAVLQKCKSTDALQKWRSETKMLQQTIKPNTNINPSESAPFGNDFNESNASETKVLGPEEYRKEITECWTKLKEFANNPAPLSDTDLALKRLQEVDKIQKKLLGLKLSVKGGPHIC